MSRMNSLDLNNWLNAHHCLWCFCRWTFNQYRDVPFTCTVTKTWHLLLNFNPEQWTNWAQEIDRLLFGRMIWDWNLVKKREQHKRDLGRLQFMPTLLSCAFALPEMPVNYQMVKTIMQGKIFCEAAFIGTTSAHLSPMREKTWTTDGGEQLQPSGALWK